MRSDIDFSSARVLITGGLGFMGSSLAIRLAGLGAHVSIVDNLFPDYGGNLFNVEPVRDQLQIEIADIRERDTVYQMVQGQDYLFNLAGQTSHLDSMINPMADLEINCRAQLSILEACRAVNPKIHVVFASTRQVYGRPDVLPVPETHSLRPVDINGVNKLAAEFYHRLYWEVHGIPTCVLRFTNTIGPRMRIRDARQTFLGVWIRAVIEDRSFEVWEGSQLRDFTYIDDAVDALLQAARPDAVGLVLNVGGTPPMSLIDVAKLLVEVNGGGNYDVMGFPDDIKRIDIGSYYGEACLIQHHLGWRASTDLPTALQLTLAYFRDNLAHYV